MANFKVARGTTPPGARSTPEYRAWQNMLRRCYTKTEPSFHNYGGRGIAVCDRWREFALFLADMGPRPPGYSLDRIDNSGHYEPGNCRWATRTEQNRNTRQTHWITIDGRTMTMREWARSAGIDEVTFYYRITTIGLDPKVALALPPVITGRGGWKRRLHASTRLSRTA